MDLVAVVTGAAIALLVQGITSWFRRGERRGALLEGQSIEALKAISRAKEWLPKVDPSLIETNRDALDIADALDVLMEDLALSESLHPDSGVRDDITGLRHQLYAVNASMWDFAAALEDHSKGDWQALWGNLETEVDEAEKCCTHLVDAIQKRLRVVWVPRWSLHRDEQRY